ncbi:MAG: hypothetical protein RJA07_1135 [Bacteroidota bacterium]|jgi:hypothetical protein
MKKKDSVPAPDADFDNFQSNLISLCTTNQVAWGIILIVLNGLTTPQSTWAAAYALCKNKRNATTTQRIAKNSAKKAFVAKLRVFIQTQIQYNTVMTDSQKQSCGIVPHSTHHVPTPRPNGRPVIDAQPGVGNQIKIRYRQEMGLDGTSRRGKPDGVAYCKIVYLVSPDAPPSPNACPTTLMITKTPKAISFDGGLTGQKVFGYGCWGNSQHQEGEWSEMFVCTIP